MKSANDKKYLLTLIEEGEHQQQDFKYKVTDAVKLARSVSAFANTDGGRLLIGVRDDGHLSGVRSEEEIFMMHAAAYKYCSPEATIKFETLHADGRTIVIATVPPATVKPVCALEPVGENDTKNGDTEASHHLRSMKKRAYIRIADENIVATPVHIEIWRQESSPVGTVTTFSADEHAILDTLSENNHIPLNRLVKLSRVSRRKAIVIVAKLVRFGLVNIEFSDHRFLFCSL